MQINLLLILLIIRLLLTSTLLVIIISPSSKLVTFVTILKDFGYPFVKGLKNF